MLNGLQEVKSTYKRNWKDFPLIMNGFFISFVPYFLNPSAYVSANVKLLDLNGENGIFIFELGLLFNKSF